MRYEIGDGVRLSVVFTDAVNGALADPTAVALTLQQPDGTNAAVVVQKDSTGKYHADYLTAQPGVHVWRWAGTGAIPAAAEGVFTVSRSLINA